MKRTMLLVATVGAALLMAGGVALAAGEIRCAQVTTTTCEGTNADDRIVGTKGHDTMFGHDGSDVMFGRGDNDEMYGGFGVDKMFGGKGNDLIRGGGGPDEIDGGPGTDQIDGETGNDTIYAVDGVKDSISCGLGPRDKAIVNDADLNQASIEDFVRLTSCETVKVN